MSFDRRTVTFRVNDHRRLKTRTSQRTIPLWPQLAEILQPYVDQRIIDRGGTVLFPGEEGRMVTDWRKMLDAIAARAGWKGGEVRCVQLAYHLRRLFKNSADHEDSLSVWQLEPVENSQCLCGGVVECQVLNSGVHNQHVHLDDAAGARVVDPDDTLGNGSIGDACPQLGRREHDAVSPRDPRLPVRGSGPADHFAILPQPERLSQLQRPHPYTPCASGHSRANSS